MVTKMATTNSMTAALPVHSERSNNCGGASGSSDSVFTTGACTSAELTVALHRALDLLASQSLQTPPSWVSSCSAPEMPASGAETATVKCSSTEPTPAVKQSADADAAALPHLLPLDQIRELVFRGGCAASESTGSSESIRPLAWRILLGCLDAQPAHWREQLTAQRQQYQDWKREFLGCRRQSVVAPSTHDGASDSSTASASGSAKSALEADAALMKEIDKDVSRTQSALSFFAIGGIAQQWMLRILFVFAKLQPELGYMQGMNEILAPIVFVYGSDPHDEWARHAEADAFASFVTIMKAAALLYTKSPTDPTKSGVETQMARLTQLLRQHDAPLWQHLNSIGLTPDLYSFRWYMTLLTREFAMPATLRIWDALLADARRFSFLHYVSCALIRSQRAELLQRGFSGCLRALQTLPSVDLDRVLALAEEMRERDRWVDQSRVRGARTYHSHTGR